MSSSSSDENERELQRRKNEFDKQKVTTKDNYIREYERFMEWKMFNNEENLDENVLLKYFKELSERAKARGKCSSLQPTYCKLTSVIAKEHDLSIDSYTQLKAFIKDLKNDPQIIPYHRKPDKTFTSENIETFLNYAPDDHYFVMKVALIFGVSGACKSRELSAITVEDIEQVSEELIMVNVRGADDNDGDRSFIVCGDHINIVNKYLDMRRSFDVPTNKLFIHFKKGKLVKQAMHKNNFNQMARKIASFINLPNPELYRENCFRKTSTKLVSVVGEGFSIRKEKARYLGRPKNKKSKQKPFKNEERLEKIKLKSLKREQAPAKNEDSKSLSATEGTKPNICINIDDKSIKVQSSSDYWSKCSDSLPNLNLVEESSTVKCFTWEDSKNRDPLAANDSFVNNSDVTDSDDDSSDNDDDIPIIKKKKETTVKHVFQDCENVSNLFISL